MGIFGDLVKKAMGGFATIPDAPPPAHVDPQTAQRDSIRGNQQSLPDLMDLGSDYNAYMTRERRKALSAIPNWDRVSGGLADLIDDWSHGRLDQNAASDIWNHANAYALERGFGGGGPGGMKQYLTARDLGIGREKLKQLAAQYGPSFLNTLGGFSLPKQFDPISGFISPSQQIEAQQWNENQRYGRDWLQNQLDSIPDPAEAAIASDVGGIADIVGTALLTALGGVGGAAIGGAAGGALGSSLGGQIGGSQGGAQSGLDIMKMLGGFGGGGGGGGAITDMGFG